MFFDRLPSRRRLFLIAFQSASLGALGLLGGSARAQAPGAAPGPPPPATGTVRVAAVRQTIYGFGGSQTYNGDPLADFKQRDLVYRALFQELNLDIFRLRNYHGYPGQEKRFEKVVGEFARATRRWGGDKTKRNGKEAARLMFTSWSPPAALKSNNLVSGRGDGTERGAENATLKRDASGAFVYGEFADWWLASLQKFHGLCGAYPDYIAIQNELDISVSYEGCRFSPSEGPATPGGIPYAGYDRALAAVSDRLTGALGKQSPRLLGPETFTIRIEEGGINHARPFADPATPGGRAVLDRLFGVSFHNYGVEAETPNHERFHKSLESLHDVYGNAGKPLFETEFLEGNTLTALAEMIHDTLTIGEASAYLVWITARSAKMPGYALVYFHPEDGTIEKRERFYAMKHFSAFVGEGWHRVESPCDDPAVKLSAYLSPDSRRMAAVLINPSDQVRRVSLTADSDAFKNATTAVYRSSEGENGERWQELGKLPADNLVTLPKRSVATVVFDKPVR